MAEDRRLNKFISDSGFCSRREADQLIAAGRVSVNGHTASVGERVPPGARVKVDGKPIQAETEKVYLAVYKPVGIVCTADTRETYNIVDYINHKERIYPIGRLDKDSEGLILMTSDGDIVNRILRAELAVGVAELGEAIDLNPGKQPRVGASEPDLLYHSGVKPAMPLGRNTPHPAQPEFVDRRRRALAAGGAAGRVSSERGRARRSGA